MGQEQEKVKRYISAHPDYVISDIQRLLMNDRTYCMKLLEEMGELIWINNQWLYKRDIEAGTLKMKQRRSPLKRIAIFGGLACILVGLAIIGYTWTQAPQESIKVQPSEQTMEDTKTQIEKEILSVTQKDNEAISAMHDQYSKPEAAIDYLFGIAMLDKTDMFPDAFTPDRFFEDFKAPATGSKVESITEAMNRLTKSGTLTKTKIMKTKGSLEKGTSRFVVALYYQALDEPIRVQIKVQKSEPGKEMFRVQTSVWDIIDKVEQG